MHIEQIEIKSLNLTPDGKSVRGSVEFRIAGKGGRPAKYLTVTCDTLYSHKIRPDALLIGDAIRQLRRTPEVRAGLARLSFAKGLKPLSTSKAA